MRDEIARLAKALEPSFTTPEDAELAATMMVRALRYEFPRSRGGPTALPGGAGASPQR